MGPSASVAALVWRKEKGSTTSAFTTSRKRSHDNFVSSVSAEGDGDDGADQEPTYGGMLPLSLGADVAA